MSKLQFWPLLYTSFYRFGFIFGKLTSANPSYMVLKTITLTLIPINDKITLTPKLTKGNSNKFLGL